MTDAEIFLWNYLKAGVQGLKFRRQHPIGIYIADFYCHELKLIIEIDGGIHRVSENKEYDISRGITLNELGIQIIRFTNDQAIKNTDWVIEEIKKIITTLKQSQIQLHRGSEKAG